MSSLLVEDDSSDDEESEEFLAAEEAAGALLVPEDIAPNTIHDRLVLRLVSHTSSVVDIKRSFVSDLMPLFKDKSLHQQLPNYLHQALNDALTPHVSASGPNALKNICK